jgi:mycothiol S-conjugate amidase
MATTAAPHDFARFDVESHWFRREPTARTLLIIYAHPDDESFGNAGTIARYAASGVGVHYACATRGECGTVAEEHLREHVDIAALRTAELDCAARTLGLAAVHHLGYRDSGMAGSADNDHPSSLVRAPREKVAGQLVALMRSLRPQVVVTFNPYGGYGHPDHIAIHHATLDAFAAAADPARYAEQLADGLSPWTPGKLYYSTFGTAFLRLGITAMRLMRRDPRRFGENQDIDMVRAANEVTPITTAIDSGAYLAVRDRAVMCHRSQLGGMEQMQRIPVAVRRRFMSTEYFTRVVPAWNGRARRERDLFAEIDV